MIDEASARNLLAKKEVPTGSIYKIRVFVYKVFT